MPDFLADDGGLSAILGVVTVRFADQEIRNLLVQRIANEEGDETIKSRMVEAVRSLPAEAIKGIGTKAIEHGIASFPAGLAAIRAMLEI